MDAAKKKSTPPPVLPRPSVSVRHWEPYIRVTEHGYEISLLDQNGGTNGWTYSTWTLNGALRRGARIAKRANRREAKKAARIEWLEKAR